MSMMEWFGWLIIGAVAGWLASITAQINKQHKLWGDVIIGMVGALIGGVLFYRALPIPTVNIWSLFVAFTGSVLLLGMFRLLTFLIGTQVTENQIR